MKKTSTLAIAALGMLLGTYAKAQIDVPVSSVSLEFPGNSPQWVTLHIVSAPDSINVTETVNPTPFLISLASLNSINSWLCMDPLQRIYYGGPAGPNIHYGSTNPTDFDKWVPSAPGLDAVRVQDLADLFKAYSTIPDTAANAGALQLAVWEITNEFNANGFHLGSGAFYATGNATEIALAQSMLDSLTSITVQNKGNVGSLSFLIDGNLADGTPVQDLVGYNPATINLLIPVPEPSTYGLGAVFGLGLITAIRRRRARA